MPDDTAKVNYIINYFNVIYNSHPEVVKQYAHKISNLSKRLNYPEGEARSYGWLLVMHYLNEKYDSCIFYYKKLIPFNSNSNLQDLFAEVHNNIANVYFGLNDYEKAMDYFTKSADYYAKMNDSTGYFITRSNIIKLLSKKKEYAEEEKLLNEALHYFTRTNQKIYQTNTLIYLANNQFHQSDFNTAEKYIKLSIGLAEQLNDTILLYTCYADLSKFLFSMNKHSEAKEYALKSIYFQKNKGIYNSVAFDYLFIAKGLISNQQYSEAIIQLDSALFYQQKYCRQAQDIKSSIYENYAKAYYNLKQYEIAFLYHERFKTSSDSLNLLKNNENVNELQEKYFATEKENKIILLEKEQLLKDEKNSNEQKSKIYLIFLLVFILLIILLLVSRSRAKQKIELEKQKIIDEKNKTQIEKEMIELEQKLLLTQMNPHFIFNSLNSIRAFIAKNEGFKATEYLGDFAKLMRLILESSRKKLIPIEDEIKILDYYLKLEQVRNNNSFNFTITLDDVLIEDIDDYTIPPMLIQPFVENSIHHGFSNLNKQGEVAVFFKQINENSIEVTIQDNGVGRKNVESLKEKFNIKYESFALKITEERIKHLANEFGTPITYSILDLHEGTKVSFIIPIFTK